MQSNEDYMQLAITAARKSAAEGGAAIAALLVDTSSGEVVAIGHSLVGPTQDPTAHAEMNAIRAASQKLHTSHLSNLSLYCTLEPCHMCLSAAAWADIPHIYFSAYRKDVDESLFDIKGDFSDEREGKRMNLRGNLSMHVIGGILEATCTDLLKSYHKAN